MADSKSAGVFIPYPVLGLLLTIALACIGSVVALYTKVSGLETTMSTINATMVIRDNQHLQELKDLKDELSAVRSKEEQTQVYFHDDRERIIRLQAAVEGRRR